jgi:hypothetical protein
MKYFKGQFLVRFILPIFYYIVTQLLEAFQGNGSANTFHHARMENMSQLNVIARCWVTASAPMNSLGRNHVTCVFCLFRAGPV